MDLDPDVHLKSNPVNTHTYSKLLLILDPRAYFSLDHCDSPLPLSPCLALGKILNCYSSIGKPLFAIV